MDDIVIIVKDKQTANTLIKDIKRFLEAELNLCVNPRKTKVFPLVSKRSKTKTQTINAIGYKIYSTHKLLRNKSKKKIKEKVKKLPFLINYKGLSKYKAEQMLNSWLGHAIHADSKNFIYKLVNNYSYVKLKNNTLKLTGEIT